MTARTQALDADQVAIARPLLEDGASYREAARTLGVHRARVMRALPGYGWTYPQAGHFTASVRCSRARARRASETVNRAKSRGSAEAS